MAPPLPPDHVALICSSYPRPGKSARVLDLLSKGASYYRRPSSQCVTWSWLLPLRPALAADGASSPEEVLASVEIYSSKRALQTQLEDRDFFQAFHNAVRDEDLYARPESMVAWYFTAGFLLRSDKPERGGHGVRASLTNLTCRKGETAACLDTVVRPFAEWVRANQPDVLTYAVFTRPKATTELVFFVRYRDGAAMRSHSEHPEHVRAAAEMERWLEQSPSTSGTTVWKEVDNSFVSTVDGGGHTDDAKL